LDFDPDLIRTNYFREKNGRSEQLAPLQKSAVDPGSSYIQIQPFLCLVITDPGTYNLLNLDPDPILYLTLLEKKMVDFSERKHSGTHLKLLKDTYRNYLVPVPIYLNSGQRLQIRL
jgi:hypothetical protein